MSQIKRCSAIIEAIKNPPKDMPSVEELRVLKEEINMEFWGNKEGVPAELVTRIRQIEAEHGL